MIKEVTYYILCCDKCCKEASIEPTSDKDVAVGLAIDDCGFSLFEENGTTLDLCKDCSLATDSGNE